MNDKWMPPSAEPVATTSKDSWSPGSAEPVAQTVSTRQPNPIMNNIGSYFQNAQPAFKLAVTQPQTIFGMPAINKNGSPMMPNQLDQQTNQSWADIYRNATLKMPFANSTSIAGQMVPQAVGMGMDIATRPSSYLLGAALPGAANALANNPVTRRFLQTQLPSMTADLLKANPMAPIYKTINGIQADITKPLPPSAPRLVQIGKNLADSINQSIDTLGSKYKAIIGSNPLSPAEVKSALPDHIAEAIGVDPANIKTTADLWKARTDLSSLVNDPWAKQALMQKTSMKENDVMDMMNQMKALVMNKMNQPTRDSLDVLDNHYGTAISAGKGLLRSIINPATGEVKTGSLANIFRKDSAAYAGKQDLLNKLNYFNSNVGKFGQQVNSHISMQARNEMFKNTIGYTGGAGTAAWLANKFILQPALRGAQSATGIDGESGN